MGSADYYLHGAWNFRCQECGKKLKSVDIRLRWDGFRVGPECWEIRNPQDFIRGIPDDQSVPWSSNPPPNFIGTQQVNQLTGPSMLIDSYLLDEDLLG